MTFFSLPSFMLKFLPPSLAKPGTGAGAGGGRLNVYDAIRSKVIHSRTFRARQGNWEAVPVVGAKKPPLNPGPPVLGICGLGEPVRLTLSSSYWPVYGPPRQYPNPASTCRPGHRRT